MRAQGAHSADRSCAATVRMTNGMIWRISRAFRAPGHGSVCLGGLSIIRTASAAGSLTV